jgi:SAM-dependent methyltransferase
MNKYSILNFALRKLISFLPLKIQSILCFEVISKIGRWLTPDFDINSQTPHYLNLGCGPQVIDGFVNIDFFTSPGISYGADIRYPLKISNNIFDGIICEHTFEHLSYVEASRLMHECYRILKPGGILRVIVPDLELFIRNYSNQNKMWFAEWEKLMFSESIDFQRVNRRLSSKLEAISFVTQEYGHVSCWDFETLEFYLTNAGFSEVKKGYFRVGVSPQLLVDLDGDDRKFVSVYVDAVKSLKR